MLIGVSGLFALKVEALQYLALIALPGSLPFLDEGPVVQPEILNVVRKKSARRFLVTPSLLNADHNIVVECMLCQHLLLVSLRLDVVARFFSDQLVFSLPLFVFSLKLIFLNKATIVLRLQFFIVFSVFPVFDKILKSFALYPIFGSALSTLLYETSQNQIF